MKINPEDIKVPLEKVVEVKNREVQVSIGKMTYAKAEMYKSFMSTCASDDKALIDTTDMDDESTMKACAFNLIKWKKCLWKRAILEN